MKKKKATKASLKKMVEGAARQVEGKKGKKTSCLKPKTVENIERELAKYGKTIQKVPVNLIHVGENIRKKMEPKALQNLANSLKKDGLIQYPTLSMQTSKLGTRLVCRNGHRRIEAAKLLGWAEIEAVILPLSSDDEILFHSLNANQHEAMFYLDLAKAYEAAYEMGLQDQEIADRVGVNKRTVGWYRRWAGVSPACEAYIRSHSLKLGKTWAIQLARKGALPQDAELLKLMKRIVEKEAAPKPKRLKPSPQKKLTIEKRLGEPIQDSPKTFLKSILWELSDAGYLGKHHVKRIEKDFLFETFSENLVKHSRKNRQPKTRSKKAYS